MPVVKQVTLYSFDELSEQAQQKAIETARGWDDLFEPDEQFVLEGFAIQNPHIENMDISYSGFCSQGDGASFTGSINTEWVIDNLLSDELKTIVRDMDCRFERNDTLKNSMLDQHYDKILDAIEEYRVSLCHSLYGELEQAYEQCHSDENIIELIKANEYLFDIDGNFE